jgi:hypothetical protein
MDQYLEVIQKSKNIPRNVDFTNLSDAKLQPVSPDGFDILDEELSINGSAVDAVQYVQTVTEEYRKEYTLVLYGKRKGDKISFRDYSFAEGNSSSAKFQKEQLYLAKKSYRERNGEVIYAHTHVARGVSYNCFSVNDLVFLVKQAFSYNRDVYAILITKDGAVPIKYSLAKNEFFRVRLKVKKS